MSTRSKKYHNGFPNIASFLRNEEKCSNSGWTSEITQIWILGKIGLDAHDNGLRIVSKWLMDSSYEIIYAGLYNNPQRIVQMAIEENADAIGISFLGGEHLFYTDKLIKELRQNEMGNVKVIIGGVIPPGDVLELKSIGVHAIFTPGTPKQKILDTIESLFG